MEQKIKFPKVDKYKVEVQNPGYSMNELFKRKLRKESYSQEQQKQWAWAGRWLSS